MNKKNCEVNMGKKGKEKERKVGRDAWAIP